MKTGKYYLPLNQWLLRLVWLYKDQLHTAGLLSRLLQLFTCCQPFPSHVLDICRKNIIMTLWPKKVIKPTSTWQTIWNGINHNYYVIILFIEWKHFYVSCQFPMPLYWGGSTEGRGMSLLYVFRAFHANCSRIRPSHSDDFSSSFFQSTSFFKSWTPHFKFWCMHLNFKQDFPACLWPLGHCSAPHSTGGPIPPPQKKTFSLVNTIIF